jgi:hypothetical protein
MLKVLAVLAVGGGCVGSALAAGFVEDSKATLSMRNFYINQDTRNDDAPGVREWGQGFALNLQSGFTEGPIGFGVDALGLYGIRLDGGGKADKPGIKRKPSVLFPTDSDGSAVSEYGRLELTAKVRYSKSLLQLGSLQPKLPVLTYNDGRLLPQTFEGVQLTSNEIDHLKLTFGRIEHVTDRNSTDDARMTLQGNNAQQTSNEFIYGGGDYAFSPNLQLQYYYANLENFYTQHFVGLLHQWQLPVGVLKTDLRYFDSSADGKNGSAAGRADGYYAPGQFSDGSSKGEVDNRLFSAMFTYQLNGHALGLGYQQVNGHSDFPHLNQGEGRTLYLITNAQLNKFASAGEKTWVAAYTYDFAAAGVPGLKASVNYFNGRGIDAKQGENREWERDLRVDYVIPSGTFKGVGLTWRHGMIRGNDAKDRDENRLIVNYSIPLL